MSKSKVVVIGVLGVGAGGVDVDAGVTGEEGIGVTGKVVVTAVLV